MASCTQCSLTFNHAIELKAHAKQLHSARISVKFISEPDILVIFRDIASNKFTCPGCDKQFEKYQQIYNHSKRVLVTDTSHATKLREYLKGGVVDQDEAMDGSDGSDGPSAERDEDLGVDSIMMDCMKGSYSTDSAAANFNDIDMDLFYSPYKETPPTTPKQTPKTDNMNDVDMGAFYSPYKATPPTTLKRIPSTNKPISSNSEDSRPRYSAAEKGKQREIPSQLPRPSNSPPTSLHNSPPHAAPLKTPLTGPPNPASEGPQCLSLPVPYGTKNIVSTVLLNTINCVLYLPLRILICVVCSIAVQPRSLGRHRKGGVHMDERPAPKTLVNHLNDLHVLDGDVLQDLPLPFPAVPGIPFLLDGLKCPLQDCNHCCQSRKTMGAHIKSTHSLSIKDQNPTACTIQAIFDSNNKYYPVTLPQSPQARKSPSNLDEMTKTQYHRIVSQIDSSALLDPAHLTPFLAKYKWHTVVANLEPSSPSEWTSVPRADETALTGLSKAVFEYYLEIAKEMGAGESWTTVLRFVNTAKL